MPTVSNTGLPPSARSDGDVADTAAKGIRTQDGFPAPVSYTHLTLPTILRV